MNPIQNIVIDYFQFQSQIRTEVRDGKQWIFDPIRKKFLVLQPEEMVRQLLLQYLMIKKAYSPLHIKVERGLALNKMRKRYDILVYDKKIQAQLLVECKAPGIKLDQAVIDQIARYNMVTKVPYLFLTNGQQNYCLKIDYSTQEYEFMSEVPHYQDLLKESE